MKYEITNKPQKQIFIKCMFFFGKQLGDTPWILLLLSRLIVVVSDFFLSKD